MVSQDTAKLIFHVEDLLLFYNAECLFKRIVYSGIFLWPKPLYPVILGGCCLPPRGPAVIMTSVLE